MRPEFAESYNRNAKDFLRQKNIAVAGVSREKGQAAKFIYLRLKELGYEIRYGQHPVIPSRTMYVDDPDGNEVEFICGA